MFSLEEGGINLNGIIKTFVDKLQLHHYITHSKLHINYMYQGFTNLESSPPSPLLGGGGELSRKNN